VKPTLRWAIGLRGEYQTRLGCLQQPASGMGLTDRFAYPADRATYAWPSCSNVTGERQNPPDGDGAELDSVLHALRALCPSVTAPSCCTWVCSAVVGDVRRRRRGAPGGLAGAGPDLDGSVLEFPDLEFPDLEFEAVLVRRLAHRYLKVVADARAGRAVPRAWQLLFDPPPVSPTRLALAGVGIAYVFEPLARPELRTGLLRQVLPRSAFEEPGLFLYFPRRASQAPKLRAFIDVARDLLNASTAPASTPST